MKQATQLRKSQDNKTIYREIKQSDKMSINHGQQPEEQGTVLPGTSTDDTEVRIINPNDAELIDYELEKITQQHGITKERMEAAMREIEANAPGDINERMMKLTKKLASTHDLALSSQEMQQSLLQTIEDAGQDMTDLFHDGFEQNIGGDGLASQDFDLFNQQEDNATQYFAEPVPQGHEEMAIGEDELVDQIRKGIRPILNECRYQTDTISNIHTTIAGFGEELVALRTEMKEFIASSINQSRYITAELMDIKIQLNELIKISKQGPDTKVIAAPIVPLLTDQEKSQIIKNLIQSIGTLGIKTAEDLKSFVKARAPVLTDNYLNNVFLALSTLNNTRVNDALIRVYPGIIIGSSPSESLKEYLNVARKPCAIPTSSAPIQAPCNTYSYMSSMD